MLVNLFRALTAGALMAMFHAGAWASDADAIIHVMKQQFDRPDAPLTVAPVTVLGKYAVAGWLQGDKGGRALLQKSPHGWSIMVCAGDGLKDAKVLETTGMSAATAQRLGKAVVQAESTLSATTRQRFASFEGFMRIDVAQGGGHAAHPAPAGHQGPEPAKSH